MRIPHSPVLLFLLLTAPLAHAGLLYKCEDAKGATTVQSEPCAAGSKEIWKRDSAPAPQPTLQQVIGAAAQPKPAAATTTAPAPVIAQGVWENGGAAPAADAPAVVQMFPDAPERASAAAPEVVVAPAPVAASTPDAADATPSANPDDAAPVATSEPQEQTVFVPAAPRPQIQSTNACDSAKIFAAQLREKVWLGLNQDQTQRLYGWVMSECDKPAPEDSNTSN